MRRPKSPYFGQAKLVNDLLLPPRTALAIDHPCHHVDHVWLFRWLALVRFGFLLFLPSVLEQFPRPAEALLLEHNMKTEIETRIQRMSVRFCIF